MRRQGRDGIGGVVCLHGQDAAPEAAGEPVRRVGRRRDAPRRHRAGDLEAPGRDGGDVVGRRVDEDDPLAGTQEGRAERAADGAGAPHEDRVAAGPGRLAVRGAAHDQGPSSTARVSATATSQMASMSASGRW